MNIYVAASLFSGREANFNIHLADLLEQKGYFPIVPQRDGFEFGRLIDSLKGRLSAEDVQPAVQNVIYFLDMGVFVPKSDVVVANLDEPIDEGVVVEMAYARLMGKYVIGHRTDARSPYGGSSDPLGGIHFFPAYQCDDFIRLHMPCQTTREADNQMMHLVNSIHKVIENAGIVQNKPLPDYALSNPHISGLLHGADILFKNIKNIHSNKGLEEIAQRYIDNIDELKKLGPKVHS